jgi:hydrogenase maturation protease
MKWFAEEGGDRLMSRVLIIGYGNPLRSDDGVGWRAAEELERRLSGRGVEIITRHQLTPELADTVSGSAVVFFVDARRDGMPGTVTCLRVEPQALLGPFSHQLSPGAVLGLAQELYGRIPPAFTFSVCGERFEIGETLSQSVAENLPDLVARVAAMACPPGSDSSTK